MAFTAPSAWRWMPIPALYSVSERLFEFLNGSILLTGKGASFADALDRLSHGEPRTSMRRPEQEDAMLCTPRPGHELLQLQGETGSAVWLSGHVGTGGVDAQHRPQIGRTNQAAGYIERDHLRLGTTPRARASQR